MHWGRCRAVAHMHRHSQLINSRPEPHWLVGPLLLAVVCCIHGLVGQPLRLVHRLRQVDSAGVVGVHKPAKAQAYHMSSAVSLCCPLTTSRADPATLPRQYPPAIRDRQTNPCSGNTPLTLCAPAPARPASPPQGVAAAAAGAQQAQLPLLLPPCAPCPPMHSTEGKRCPCLPP